MRPVLERENNVEELNDMKIKLPIKEGDTKEIRTGALMTGMEDKIFPTGGSPTEHEFVGAEGTKTLEEWMSGKKAPQSPDGKDLPWMGRV